MDTIDHQSQLQYISNNNVQGLFVYTAGAYLRAQSRKTINYQSQLEYILNKNVPLLFVDTCAYLDVLRIAHREDMRSAYLDDLHKLIQHFVMEGKLLFITSEIVKDEFLKNHGKTLNELKQQYREYQRLHRKMADVMSTFAPIQRQRLPYIDDTWIEPLNIFCENNIKQHSIIFAETDEDKLRAFGRATTGKAPAKQNKPSPKDCSIFETLLRVIRDLRELEFSQNVCFISSNTKDFGTVSKPLVKDDLDKHNILFANNFSHAKHLLGI